MRGLDWHKVILRHGPWTLRLHPQSDFCLYLEEICSEHGMISIGLIKEKKLISGSSTTGKKEVWILLHYTTLSIRSHACVWAQLLQLFPAVCNLMDCSQPGSAVHGILQARILEWITVSFSRGSSPLREWTCISCIAGRFFTHWATWDAHKVPYRILKLCGFKRAWGKFY